MYVMEVTERLLNDGRVEAAMRVMDYALDVVSSERVQLRADRDAARQKIMDCGMAASFKPPFDVFDRIGKALAGIITGLQKPHAKSDYAKAN